LQAAPEGRTESDFAVYGFLSQGLVYTTDNNYFGSSQNGSLDFRDLAVGASWRPGANLQFAGQLMYRDAGNTARENVFVDYAFVDFSLYQSLESQTGIRLGRVKNIYGLYNDTRDIASARPSILIPESIYLEKWRDVFHSSDAVSIYGSIFINSYLLSLDANYGRPYLSDVAEREIHSTPLSGAIKDSTLSMSRLMLESPRGNLRFAYSHILAKWNYQPNPGMTNIQIGPGNFVDVPTYGYPGGTVARLNTWSVEYTRDKWQFTSEYNSSSYRLDGVLQPGVNTKVDVGGYYYGVAYQVDRQLRVFLRRDTWYPNKDDKSGVQSANLTGQPAHNFYARDTVLGCGHELNKHWFVGAEVHHITGAAWLAESENDLNHTQKNWDLIALLVNYQF